MWLMEAYGGPKADMGPKNTRTFAGRITKKCTIYQVFVLTQFTSHTWQCLLVIKAKRHSQTHVCRLCRVQERRGSITKATGLGNQCSPVQRGQLYNTGQFTVTLYENVIFIYKAQTISIRSVRLENIVRNSTRNATLNSMQC